MALVTSVNNISSEPVSYQIYFPQIWQAKPDHDTQMTDETNIISIMKSNNRNYKIELELSNTKYIWLKLECSHGHSSWNKTCNVKVNEGDKPHYGA